MVRRKLSKKNAPADCEGDSAPALLFPLIFSGLLWSFLMMRLIYWTVFANRAEVLAQ
jgi:hypothetical protein